HRRDLQYVRRDGGRRQRREHRAERQRRGRRQQQRRGRLIRVTMAEDGGAGGAGPSSSVPASSSDGAPAPAGGALRRGVLLTVAYDGGPFAGFALQPSQRTVAGELLGALRAVDPTVREIRGASRTDAGVHARGQRVAFDTG